ncbi:malonyl CoA-acyl carrier protein transacylase-like [Bradysia coprophila]|uniref:malonyl CoA-acyl carrier protein transacylase-like n=1 Tax=Bradysia coprophila TaxID=38358 RepID=UPI00187DD7E2|nr:malonyl CoA-acyl carrier protein transacylase-like [Bradysia coprophila]
MPGETAGPAYESIDAFFPATKFIDIDTVGYENVKNESDVKLLRLSAPSRSLLSLKIENYSKNPFTPPKTIGTHEHCNKFRHALLYSSVSNLTNALSKSAPKLNSPCTAAPKLCFLITCQATQYSGMGKEVYGWSPVFRRHFDACNAVIEEDFGLSVKSLMESDDNAWVTNPLEALPYLLSLQYALAKLWESWGVKPDIVLGMSFGEYGAAVISGIISLRDAVKLIMTRTQLVTENIQEEAFGTVEMDYREFDNIMRELRKEEGMDDAWLDIACVNSPMQTCVVGLRRYVHRFVDICKERGARGMVMDPYHPYHSRLTAPVIPQFKEVTNQVEYKKATNGTFISTVRNGRIMESLDKDYYLEHLQGAALFADAITTVLKEKNVTHFLEIGPHPINIQMVKDILSNNFPEMGTNFEFYSSLTRKESDRLTLFNTLGRLYTAGVNINWENVN